MDFWTSTGSAVLGGVATFLITGLIMVFVERRKTWSQGTSSSSNVSHSNQVSVEGDNTGHIEPTINDYRSYKKSKTTVNNPPASTSTPQRESNLDEIIGAIVGAVLLTVVIVAAFVLVFPYLLLLMSLALGLLLAITVATVVRSFKTDERLSALAVVFTIRVIILIVGFTATWVAVRSSVRGVMNLDQMNDLMAGEIDQDSTGEGPVSDFFTDVFARVSLFFKVYSWPGVGFVLLLMLAIALIGILMSQQFSNVSSWRWLLDRQRGRQLSKNKKKRSRRLEKRSTLWLVLGTIGYAVVASLAILLGSGLGFDGAVALFNISQAGL